MIRNRTRFATGIVAAILPVASFVPVALSQTTAPANPRAVPATQAAGDPTPRRITAPSRPDQFLTQDQLVEAFREKQFSLLIRESRRILDRPKTIGNYNEFNVRVLLAEAYLQDKNFKMAIDAFTAAAKEGPDDEKKALMVATAELIEHRTGLKYMALTTDELGAPMDVPGESRPRKPVPIDLLDLSQRDAAFRALFWDQLDATRKAIGAAGKSGGGISAVQATLDAVENISVLETAARGNQRETDKLKTEAAVAGEQALADLVAALPGEIGRIDHVGKELEQVIVAPESVNPPRRGTMPPAPQPVWRERGLTLVVVHRLEAICDMMDKLPDAADEMVRQLHADPKVFDDTKAKAVAVKAQAKAVLDTYSEAGLLR
jgi:hypothetical protein